MFSGEAGHGNLVLNFTHVEPTESVHVELRTQSAGIIKSTGESRRKYRQILKHGHFPGRGSAPFRGVYGRSQGTGALTERNSGVAGGKNAGKNVDADSNIDADRKS